ncbi:MAG: aromatic hydrocarbon degradation membrane protein [Candidatus Magnetoglobus multicellularis str. Araruama]|uniref:Aromatic hydrocarbon degradation membrane protein n=1 Tax=Candidatus Magnetoglobus multicellularis str. Araruama TaxID=890399 RepID=A0A1V1P9C0_9BACT|nr:MAG: aromatic hydrocarbon degradation membrane protein [Candidatus Magnetoglobus multicellularis str. Araruama]
MKRIIYQTLILFFATNIQAFDGISTKSIGLGGAVTATPPGLMAIHHNPSGLSQAREGFVYYQGLHAIAFKRKNQFSPDDSFQVLGISASQDPVANHESASGNTCLYYPIYGDAHGEIQILPLPTGMTFRPQNSRWIFATGVYMPFLQGIQFDADDPSQYQTQSYYQQHLVYASPSIAYHWSESFSLGMSVGIGQTAWGQSANLRIINDRFSQSYFLPPIPNIGPFDGFSRMQWQLRDDFSMSFNLGILWAPGNNLTVGCVYRSAIPTQPKGQLEIHFSDDFMTLTRYCRNHRGFSSQLNAYGLENIEQQHSVHSVSMDQFKWPDSFQIGLQYDWSRNFCIMFDIQWTRWSHQNDYQLVFQNKDNPLVLLMDILDQTVDDRIVYPRKMKDTVSCHLGMEWQVKESFKLRGGVSYHPQTVSDSHMSLIDIPDKIFMGTGFEWRWPNRWVIEQAVGIYLSTDKTIDNGTSQRLNQLDMKRSYFSPYGGQQVSSQAFGVIFSMNVRVPFSLLE